MNIINCNMITLSQRCFNVGPPSSTSAQHQDNFGIVLDLARTRDTFCCLPVHAVDKPDSIVSNAL